jgi:hypothetical protein
MAATGSAGAAQWTPAQLQSLASAYSAKNPGWAPPVASGARTPAQLTWTRQNLDALARAYEARNPGWKP